MDYHDCIEDKFRGVSISSSEEMWRSNSAALMGTLADGNADNGRENLQSSKSNKLNQYSFR